MRSLLSIAAAFGAVGALLGGVGAAALFASAGLPVWVWVLLAVAAGVVGGLVGLVAATGLPLARADAANLANAIREIEALGKVVPVPAADAPVAVASLDDQPTEPPRDNSGPPELLAAIRATAASLADQRARAARELEQATVATQRLQQAMALVQKRLGDAEKRHQASLTVQEAFLSRMSHELRTPLNAISGYAEILLEEAEGGPAAADLNRIRLASLNLTALVTGVLDLTELQSGSYAVRPEPLDLSTLIAEVIDSVRVTADNQQDVLEVEVEAGMNPVLDKRMVRSVLFNLVSNACKYTIKGVVRVVARRAPTPVVDAEFSGNALTGPIGPAIVLEVTDTGIGMTKRQVEAAFRPFKQADETSTRRYDGSGVGLAVVKGFAEAMGGIVSIESEYGKGATVRVRLPMVAVPRTSEDPFGEDEPTMLLR